MYKPRKTKSRQLFVTGKRSEFEDFILKYEINPRDAANVLGVSLNSIYQWMAGTRRPKDIREKKELLLAELCPGRLHEVE